MSSETHLIIPAAGQSTRYGLGYPKFLLQHPNGLTMLENAIYGLGALGPETGLTKIVIISTDDHFSSVDVGALRDEMASATNSNVEFHYLKKQTSSVVETLADYLERLDSDVSVVVKDSDNMVKLELDTFLNHENALAYADLSAYPRVSAPSKSYIEIGAADVVANFVEKRVISNFFSVGLTKFGRASDVLDAARTLKTGTSELYVSDLVRSMMRNGIDFQATEILGYEDWGTLRDWLEFVGSHKTLFVDIDGIVNFDAGRFTLKVESREIVPIPENVTFLLELEKTGRVKIVFTTSRSDSFAESLADELLALGFAEPRVIPGLYKAQSLIVSPFSDTNPSPSALAISLKKNSPDLRQHIAGLLYSSS